MNRNAKIAFGVLAVAVVAVFAYSFLTMPDQRSGADQIGDAIGKLDEGVDDAARELEDRTPAQRISDEVEDATDGDPN